jgi:uncharacterized membrane protein HdeD (DUF308 family)
LVLEARAGVLIGQCQAATVLIGEYRRGISLEHEAFLNLEQPERRKQMNELEGTVTDWIKDAKKNAGMLMVFGVVAVIAGFLALVAPWAGGVGVAMFIGVALVIGGVARLVGAFSAGSFGRGTLAFIGGALALLAGVVMVARPDIGLATLTLMLGAYLLIDGIFGVVLAFQVKPEKGWGWMLFSAAMSLLLGFLLLKEWPLTGLWAIGTLVGINLLFGGFWMISIGSSARKLATAEA